MIAAFFSKNFDSKELFQELLITESPHFSLHINQYRVIFISLNEMPRRCSSYERYIERIEKKLIQDLENAYPNADIDRDDAVWDVLKTIYNTDSRERFLFVLDEWDYIRWEMTPASIGSE